MKVLFFLRYSRSAASSRVRGFYMAGELKKKGVNCDTIYGYGNKAYANFLAKFLMYNIIYFQKRYSWMDIKLNKIVRLSGKKTFFDIDDAPGGTKLSVKAEKQAAEMIRKSSAAIVGSHKLRDFAQNFNDHVYLIPSSINLNYYKPPKIRSQGHITLGWIGNGINYKKDLLILIKPLEKIGQKYDIKLTIIGALGQKEIYSNFNKMENITVEIIDWVNGANVPSAISDFDIGLYPLLDNEYNQYKCGFKALEYMAMEIPVVASPVGENTFIVENGKDGFLASNESKWIENLTYLIENEDFRKKMGKIGRTKVEKIYSLEAWARKLIAVFREIERR